MDSDMFYSEYDDGEEKYQWNDAEEGFPPSERTHIQSVDEFLDTLFEKEKD